MKIDEGKIGAKARIVLREEMRKKKERGREKEVVSPRQELAFLLELLTTTRMKRTGTGRQLYYQRPIQARPLVTKLASGGMSVLEVCPELR